MLRLCIDCSVQCCTLRPKLQDVTASVERACKTTSSMRRHVCASLCFHGRPLASISYTY